ncbi:hypothetical protein QP775_05015 [Paenibacillus sp. UMB4589-SE434]|nr:hypothetical protein [Paenibacillus sp. UMB4589-SE434]
MKSPQNHSQKRGLPSESFASDLVQDKGKIFSCQLIYSEYGSEMIERRVQGKNIFSKRVTAIKYGGWFEIVNEFGDIIYINGNNVDISSIIKRVNWMPKWM